MNQEKRYCAECNEEIHGRRDKQFCSDYCRAAKYNQTNKDVSGLIRRVNYTIRKNRNILHKLNPSGECRIHKRMLIDSGLNLNYFTSQFQTRSGNTYYFCYDQGYLELEGDYYLLVAKEDYQVESLALRHQPGE